MLSKNMNAYMNSKFFKENGARCLVKRSPLAQLSSGDSDAFLEAIPSDCSLSATVIQNEYWPTEVYVIPVVFHIIHKNDGTGNIPDSRIYNQVQVLNEDYRAIAGTLGQQGFDVKLQFELVGITRTANDQWFRDRGQESAYKRALAWDVNSYLNVYVNSASGVTFTVTVTDVTATNRTYDSSLNIETSDSISNEFITYNQ